MSSEVQFKTAGINTRRNYWLHGSTNQVYIKVDKLLTQKGKYQGSCQKDHVGRCAQEPSKMKRVRLKMTHWTKSCFNKPHVRQKSSLNVLLKEKQLIDNAKVQWQPNEWFLKPHSRLCACFPVTVRLCQPVIGLQSDSGS